MQTFVNASDVTEIQCHTHKSEPTATVMDILPLQEYQTIYFVNYLLCWDIVIASIFALQNITWTFLISFYLIKLSLFMFIS